MHAAKLDEIADRTHSTLQKSDHSRGDDLDLVKLEVLLCGSERSQDKGRHPRAAVLISITEGTVRAVASSENIRSHTPFPCGYRKTELMDKPTQQLRSTNTSTLRTVSNIASTVH